MRSPASLIGACLIGFAMMVLFCVQEYYWATSPWMPFHFLTDRSMVGTCALNMVYQISYYTWNLYFQSFLQVVFNVSIAEAGYINNTFSVVSGFLLFIVGFAIRRTGLYRWLFYIAVPLYTFTLGLMIHFRQPNGNIGYIIMCEIFISIGGAVFILVCQLSVLSAVDHQHTSSAMSLLYVLFAKFVPIIRDPVKAHADSEAVFYFPGCGSERLFSQVGLATQAMLWHVGVQTVLPPGLGGDRPSQRGRQRADQRVEHGNRGQPQMVAAMLELHPQLMLDQRMQHEPRLVADRVHHALQMPLGAHHRPEMPHRLDVVILGERGLGDVLQRLAGGVG